MFSDNKFIFRQSAQRIFGVQRPQLDITSSDCEHTRQDSKIEFQYDTPRPLLRDTQYLSEFKGSHGLYSLAYPSGLRVRMLQRR